MKLVWPAPERNKVPILDVLRRILPAQGRLLEIASGTGQHAAFFARNLPGFTWIPSDISSEHLASIEAHRAEAGLANLASPIALDVLQANWPVEPVDAIYCANMLHIAPWECAEGLFRGAGTHLVPHGLLILYGPFRFSGAFTAESNAAFDADLKARDAHWGVRDLDDLKHLASQAGLVFEASIEMPANNHCLVFRRTRA